MAAAAAAALASACAQPPHYQANTAMPNEVWHMDSVCRFDFDIDDTLARHTLYLDIRNASSYKYSNLLLYVDIDFPDGRRITDTVECPLADDHGRWLGKGWGSLRSSEIPYKAARFPAAGTYTARVAHAMRDARLAGIADIGIHIEKGR